MWFPSFKISNWEPVYRFKQAKIYVRSNERRIYELGRDGPSWNLCSFRKLGLIQRGSWSCKCRVIALQSYWELHHKRACLWVLFFSNWSKWSLKTRCWRNHLKVVFRWTQRCPLLFLGTFWRFPPLVRSRQFASFWTMTQKVVFSAGK